LHTEDNTKWIAPEFLEKFRTVDNILLSLMVTDYLFIKHFCF